MTLDEAGFSAIMVTILGFWGLIAIGRFL